MPSLKRFLASLAIAASGLQLLPAYAAAFTDVSSSSMYGTAILFLQQNGLLEGYADNTFKPKATINRAEFSKIVASAAFDADFVQSCVDTKTPFHDVQKGAWFEKFVCRLRSSGAISGYPDGNFRPEKDINFAEAAKILASAYSVEPREAGKEWYEGVVLALESANAIPTSVAKLDSPITRGEMAEMIWRLWENKTNLASKSLVNLKHPELKIALGGNNVVRAQSCNDLRILTEEAQAQNGGMYGGNMLMRDTMGAEAGAPMPTANDNVAKSMAEPPRTGGGGDGDYSQTNVQVEGVDEADIVKTDGTNLYIVSRTKGTVRIVRATPASSMKLLSEISLTDMNVTPSEIYVEDGKLVLIGSGWGGDVMPMTRGMEKMMIAPPWYGNSRTVVRIYDVSNAESPKNLRTLTFEGNQVSSRRIDGTMYLVTQKGGYWGQPIPLSATEKDLVPLMSDTAKGSIDRASVRCADVMILPRVPSPQYLAVSAIPLSGTAEVKTSVILGSAQNVYASAENLYIAMPEWSYMWDSESSQTQEKTRIYRFSLSPNGAEIKAQGEVPGHLLNQFSMDESDETFRVATTISPQWFQKNSRSSNNLYVLDMSMNRIGEVTGIAPGETIYSARFLGDRAYMVTFQTVDPFFVIDLKDPKNPKILGALKIPGYSNYLHPYDENHVIGFGKEVDASIDADKVHSDDAVYYTAIQGMKISMFDVSDVSNPKEQWKTVIGDRGTESPLLNDHKALLFDKKRGFLAFPITVTKRPDGSDKSADGNVVFQGAHVYDVSLTKGFTLRGTITHVDDPSVFLKSGAYWYGGDTDIQRIVRIGDSLLTVSEAQVRSHGLGNMKEQGKADLQ